MKKNDFQEQIKKYEKEISRLEIENLKLEKKYEIEILKLEIKFQEKFKNYEIEILQLKNENLKLENENLRKKDIKKETEFIRTEKIIESIDPIISPMDLEDKKYILSDKSDIIDFQEETLIEDDLFNEIYFDADKKIWVGTDNPEFAQMVEKSFPGVDIASSFQRMKTWLSNGTRKRLKDFKYKKFIYKWLNNDYRNLNHQRF